MTIKIFPRELLPMLLLGLLIVAVSPGLAAAGPKAAVGNGPKDEPALLESLRGAALVPVATGVEWPVAITHAGDGTDRLFFTQQEGQIVIYEDGQLLATPFLDIADLITFAGSEQGLLSVAYHPDYESNGYFYVNYTDDSGGDTVVARYTVSADPNVADPNSALVLLEIEQPFSNHNGGQLQFGPDGYLYIGMGDGGSGGDPGDRAQDLTELLGKMLRIDVANNDTGDGLPYDIPPDNPFVEDAKARDEIWAYGLRNPWRFSFDRLTGALFIGDVGQDDWEEVDRQPSNSVGGENYGWRLMEGPDCFNPPSGCNDGSLTLPVMSYPHGSGGVCAVTGGYQYRGTALPPANGVYFFADYCSGQIYVGIPRPGGAWLLHPLVDTAYTITTFGENESGELCFADYSQNGTIYCILPN